MGSHGIDLILLTNEVQYVVFESMIWNIYSPIAGYSVNIFLLLGLGGSVGFLSGLSGVGGGFLMTPLLIMAGIPPTVAAATDSNQIVASATSGAYAHYRMGSVDFKMGLFIFAGGLVGSTAGVEIIKFMREVGEVDFFIEIIYVALLGILGSFLMADSIKCLLKKKNVPDSIESSRKSSFFDRLTQALPWKIRFDKSGLTLSAVLPVLAGCFAGMVAAILGVGGRLHHAPDNVLCSPYANACGGGHKPFSGSPRLCQCHRNAVHYKPYGRSGAGPDPVIRIHGWGTIRGQIES